MLMPGALYSMYEKKKSERRSEKWDTFSFCALLRRNRLIAPTTGIRRRIDVTMGMYARMLGRCRGPSRCPTQEQQVFRTTLYIYKHFDSDKKKYENTSYHHVLLYQVVDYKIKKKRQL